MAVERPDLHGRHRRDAAVEALVRVAVRVDEAGEDDAPGGVEDSVDASGGARQTAHGGNPAVADQDVGVRQGLGVGARDDEPAVDQEARHV